MHTHYHGRLSPGSGSCFGPCDEGVRVSEMTSQQMCPSPLHGSGDQGYNKFIITTTYYTYFNDYNYHIFIVSKAIPKIYVLLYYNTYIFTSELTIRKIYLNVLYHLTPMGCYRPIFYCRVSSSDKTIWYYNSRHSTIRLAENAMAFTKICLFS